MSSFAEMQICVIRYHERCRLFFFTYLKVASIGVVLKIYEST